MTKIANNVTNIFKLSTSPFVASIRHQHRCELNYEEFCIDFFQNMRKRRWYFLIMVGRGLFVLSVFEIRIKKRFWPRAIHCIVYRQKQIQQLPPVSPSIISKTWEITFNQVQSFLFQNYRLFILLIVSCWRLLRFNLHSSSVTNCWLKLTINLSAMCFVDWKMKKGIWVRLWIMIEL